MAHPSRHQRLAEIDEHIAEDSDDPRPYLVRGDALFHRGAWQAALDDYQRALERGADPAVVDIGRGHVLQAAGRWEEALAAADRALASAQDPRPVWRLRARALRALGRPDAAADDLRRVVAATDEPAPAVVVALAAALDAANQADEALLQLDAAMKRLGRQTSLVRQALIIELRRGDRAPAAARLGHLAKSSTRPFHWRFVWADALEHSGQAREAEDAYRHLLRDLKAHRDARPSQHRLQRSIVERLDALAASRSDNEDELP